VTRIRCWEAVLVLPLLILPTGCGSGRGAATGPSPSANPGDDGVGPYVSVAVDNHFHDIHPDNHIQIVGTRAFAVRNEGSNLHNVTILGTDITEDIKPGETFELDPVGDTLEPGTYSIVCRFHSELGMKGEITVVP
jgi:plastocyanin